LPKKKSELDSTQPKNDAADLSKPVESADSKSKKPTVKKPAAKMPDKPVFKTAAGPSSATVPTAKPTATVAELARPEAAVLPETKTDPAKPRDYKSLAIKIGAALVILLVLIVIVFGVLVYAYKSENQVVKAVSGVIPYPVERVNGQFVSYHSYLFEVDANKRAYQNNAKLNNQPAVDYNSADGKKLVAQIKQHALAKLKSDAVIAQLASQKKVAVNSKDVDKLLDDLYKRYGGKDTLLKTLNQIYGWNLSDLKGVVRKQLLAQKLQDKVSSDPALDKQAKTKAQDVLNKIKGGGDFTELAKQYSQASDASTGGDLGNVSKGQVSDEEQKAIDALQAGQVSDVFKSQYGYEIVKVVDKTGDTAHIQHILIETIDFNTYMDDQINKAKVNTYIKA